MADRDRRGRMAGSRLTDRGGRTAVFNFLCISVCILAGTILFQACNKHQAMTDANVASGIMMATTDANVSANDHEELAKGERDAMPVVSKEYPAECTWQFNKDKGGYPPIPVEAHIADYPGSATFRDMSELVVTWPFHRWEEHLYMPPKALLNQASLPPIPIIYTQVDYVRSIYGWIKGVIVDQPYILITGENDYSVPSDFRSQSQQLLDDPYLVRWYAQNNDEPHPKITPIPIGLNRFEHAAAMHEALQYQASSNITKDSLVVVNFGDSHPSRSQVRNVFCGGDIATRFAACIPKGSASFFEWYQTFMTFKYAVTPRGNGWDTHRLWEALHLGVIPILTHSPLDPTYEGLPILYVDSYESVTKELLEREFPRMSAEIAAWDRHQLSRDFWWKQIEGVRRQGLRERNMTDASPRVRCWGRKADR